MKREEKRLVVKDWFHVNKMNEKKRNVQSTNVYAILKETEKAYNVFVGDATLSMTYWVPKSCAAWENEEEISKRTIIESDYDEVYIDWKHEISFYN